MADSTHKEFSPAEMMDIEKVHSISSLLHEDKALLGLREQALQDFYQSPLPSRAESKWKYSKAQTLLPQGALVVDFQDPKHPVERRLNKAYDAEIWLDHNGQPQVLLSADAQNTGLVVSTLDQAIADGLQPGQLRGADSGILEALNLSAFAQSLYIKLPAGQKLSKPVLLHFAVKGEQNFSRLLLHLEKNSTMSLIEDHHGDEGEAIVNSVSELFVDAGARLQHSMLQRWSLQTRGYHSLRAELKADAQYLGVIASLGGREVKMDTGSILRAPGAQAELIGFILADDVQRHDVHTEQSHQAPHTWSNINFKVALAGQARAAYTGRIYIDEKAKHSEALQENRNLLLSETAQANSIPVLEILNQEVSCSHGATISSIDEKPLQYLMSRGLPRSQAMFLLLRAFLQDSLHKLPDGLVQQLEQNLEPRLRGLLT